MLFNLMGGTIKNGVILMGKNATKNNKKGSNSIVKNSKDERAKILRAERAKEKEASKIELQILEDNTKDVIWNAWSNLENTELSVFQIRQDIALQLAKIKALQNTEINRDIKKRHAFGNTSLVSLSDEAYNNYLANYDGVSYNFLNSCFKLATYIDIDTGTIDYHKLTTKVDSDGKEVPRNLSSNSITNMTGSRSMGLKYGVEAKKREDIPAKQNVKADVKAEKKEAKLMDDLQLVKDIITRGRKLEGTITQEQALSVKSVLSMIHGKAKHFAKVEAFQEHLMQSLEIK